ncbi:dermonecrotic toxin domain-containing protein [Pandoraea sp. NPDC087047]|uniref:dermonecrotic toxin domain-containing protein n=1 Tax=Pandoraea sp. NPDC087047 TaxID=3364390 RepID=UPI0037FA76CB
MEVGNNAPGANIYSMPDADQDVATKPPLTNATQAESPSPEQAAQADGKPAPRVKRSTPPAGDPPSTAGRLSTSSATANSRPSAPPASAGSEGDFLGFVKEEGKRLLAEQFPGQNLDPDNIYVNQRDVVSGVLRSSQPVTQALLDVVKDGRAPSYDLAHTGLFKSQTWDEESRVARRPYAQGSSNALVEIENEVARKLLNDPRNGSLASRYDDHLRRKQYPLANATERAQLRTFETQRRDDEAAVNRLMGETASPQHFARQQVQDHVWRKTGVTVDPDQLKVVAESGTPANPMRSELTLSEAALRGPFSSSTQFSLAAQPHVTEAQRAALTPALLSQLMGEQDVRGDYLTAQAARYQQPEMSAAANEALASRAQQSAYGAKLKGTLTTQGYNLIQRTMQSPDAVAKAGVDNALGGVKIFGGDQLKDVQVYRETDTSSQSNRYVMYAPGAPDQEYYEASSWHALTEQVGQWTGSEAGRRYLTNQLDPANRKAASMAQKPSTWSSNDVQWQAFSGGPSYRGQLGNVEAERRRTTLAESRAALMPSTDASASTAQRKQLNSLRLAAESAQQAYQAVQQPTPFAEYAHAKVSDGVNKQLRELGVTQSIDPDKVEVDLAGDGEVKMSLTNMVTYGYRERSELNVERVMKFRSTDGQDVSSLGRPEMRSYISSLARGSYIGEKYVQDTTATHLSKGPALDEKRRLHQNAVQTSLQRDALEAKLLGTLSDDQYASLKPIIDRWSSPDTASRADIASGKAAGVHTLELNGKQVHGTYAFHMPGANGRQNSALVYTPGAPDGNVFHTYDQLREGFETSNKPANQAWANYMYDRVNHTDKTEIGKVVERTYRNLDPQAHVKGGDRISADTAREYDRGVLRLTGDVSATTTTRGEVIAEQAWKGLSYAAAAVTFPFPLASAAVGVLSAGKSFADAFKSYTDGDRAAAFGDFASGVLDLAGAAGDILGKGLKGGGSLLKQAAKQRALAAAGANAVTPNALPASVRNAISDQTSTIGSSYHVQGGLPAGRQTVHAGGYMDGVVEVAPPNGASRYFAQNGNSYLEVQPDADLRQLGLVDPRKGDKQVFFETIEKNDLNHWVYSASMPETSPVSTAANALRGVADTGSWKPARTGDSLRKVEGTENVPVRNVGTDFNREYAVLDPQSNAPLPGRYIEINGELFKKPSLNGYQATLSKNDIGRMATQGSGVLDLSGKQYVKMDGKYYESFSVANGDSRYIKHPTRTGDYHEIQHMSDGTWRALPKGGKGGAPHYNFNLNANHHIASSERPGYNFPFDPAKYAEYLKNNNIKAIISLDDSLAKVKNLGQAKILKDEFDKNGIEWFFDKNYFITDFFDATNSPGADQLARTVGLMETLRYKYPGSNIMVHCGFGDGRSGTVKSAFVMHRNFLGKTNHPSVKSADVVPADVHPPVQVKAYPLVSDAINDIRQTHLGAVEREEDVQLLNEFFEYMTA